MSDLTTFPRRMMRSVPGEQKRQQVTKDRKQYVKTAIILVLYKVGRNFCT